MEVQCDVIEPELRRIGDCLAASERLLAKKSMVGLALGTLVTTCGILAGAGAAVAVAAGIAAVARDVYGAASKHLGEKRDLSLEDMFFLWKTIGHAPD